MDQVVLVPPSTQQQFLTCWVIGCPSMELRNYYITLALLYGQVSTPISGGTYGGYGKLEKLFPTGEDGDGCRRDSNPGLSVQRPMLYRNAMPVPPIPPSSSLSPGGERVGCLRASDGDVNSLLSPEQKEPF